MDGKGSFSASASGSLLELNAQFKEQLKTDGKFQNCSLALTLTTNQAIKDNLSTKTVLFWQ